MGSQAVKMRKLRLLYACVLVYFVDQEGIKLFTELYLVELRLYCCLERLPFVRKYSFSYPLFLFGFILEDDGFETFLKLCVVERLQYSALPYPGKTL